jgi:hypothetical protein
MYSRVMVTRGNEIYCCSKLTTNKNKASAAVYLNTPIFKGQVTKKTGQIGCPETPVLNKPTLCNNSDDRSII